MLLTTELSSISSSIIVALNHTSYRIIFFRNLHESKESKDYIFRCRGDIDVKGKGKMTTFFLVGRKDRIVDEPDDEYCELPRLGDADSVPNITFPRAQKKMSSKSSTCVLV